MMKKTNPQAALDLRDQECEGHMIPEQFASRRSMVALKKSACRGSLLATRIRDFESWFCPLPTQLIEDRPAFAAFYQAHSYFLALFHFDSPPKNGTEALFLLSAALGDHDLPAAEEALAVATSLQADESALLYHQALLQIAKGQYAEANDSFRTLAYPPHTGRGPLAKWIRARQRDCQAILEQL